MEGPLRASMRSTADSRGGGGVGSVSGGLAGGRAPLGPDPAHQLPVRVCSRKDL